MHIVNQSESGLVATLNRFGVASMSQISAKTLNSIHLIQFRLVIYNYAL